MNQSETGLTLKMILALDENSLIKVEDSEGETGGGADEIISITIGSILQVLRSHDICSATTTWSIPKIVIQRKQYVALRYISIGEGPDGTVSPLIDLLDGLKEEKISSSPTELRKLKDITELKKFTGSWLQDAFEGRLAEELNDKCPDLTDKLAELFMKHVPISNSRLGKVSGLIAEKIRKYFRSKQIVEAHIEIYVAKICGLDVVEIDSNLTKADDSTLISRIYSEKVNRDAIIKEGNKKKGQ